MAGSQRALTGVVVGRLDGHRDVVRVALFEAGRGDPDELRLLQHLDGRRAGVTHRGPQTPGQLVDHRRQRTAERHPALYPFGYQLVLRERVVGEVAVFGVRLACPPSPTPA